MHVYMFGSISDHSGGFNVRAVAWFTGRYRGIKASYKLLPVENELVRRSDIDFQSRAVNTYDIKALLRNI